MRREGTPVLGSKQTDHQAVVASITVQMKRGKKRLAKIKCGGKTPSSSHYLNIPLLLKSKFKKLFYSSCIFNSGEVGIHTFLGVYQVGEQHSPAARGALCGLFRAMEG